MPASPDPPTTQERDARRRHRIDDDYLDLARAEFICLFAWAAFRTAVAAAVFIADERDLHFVVDEAECSAVVEALMSFAGKQLVQLSEVTAFSETLLNRPDVDRFLLAAAPGQDAHAAYLRNIESRDRVIIHLAFEPRLGDYGLRAKLCSGPSVAGDGLWAVALTLTGRDEG